MAELGSNVDVTSLLFGYADDIQMRQAKRRRDRKPMPVIQRPDPSQETDDRLFETITDDDVMGPGAMTLRDAQGITDTKNYPEELHKSLVAIADNGTTLEIDDEDLRRIEQIEMARDESSDEVKEALDNLTSMAESKLDELTDTVDMASKREMFVYENGTKLLGSIDESNRSLVAIEEEQFAYQKDKDFDDAAPKEEDAAQKKIGETSAEINANKDQVGQGGGLLGLLGGLGGGALAVGGKFAKFLRGGLVGAIVGAVVLTADAVLRTFFDIDLLKIITEGIGDAWKYVKDTFNMIKDGISYFLENPGEVLANAAQGVADFIMDLPGYLIDALKSLGTLIRNTIADIPGLGFLASDGEGGVNTVVDSGLGLGAAGAATVGTVAAVKAANRAGVTTKAAEQAGGFFSRAKEFIQGRVGRETVSDKMSTDKPTSDNLDSKTKPGRLSRLLGGKFGTIATIAGLGYTFLGGDEEAPMDQQVAATPDLQQVQDAQMDAQADGFGMTEAIGATGLAGLATAAYMRNNRTQSISEIPEKPVRGNMLQRIAQTVTPDKPFPPGLPAPDTDDVAKAAAKTASSGSTSMLGRAGKALGRIPGLSLLAGGIDAYSVANNDELTQDEKNVQYAGVGGTIAGGALGAAIGTAAIPIPILGTLVGGVIGSIMGEEGMEQLASYVLGPEESEASAVMESGIGAGEQPDGFVERTPEEIASMSPDDREFYQIEKQIFESAQKAGLVGPNNQMQDGRATLVDGMVVNRQMADDSRPVTMPDSVDYMPGTPEYMQAMMGQSPEQGAGRANYVEDIPVLEDRGETMQASEAYAMDTIDAQPSIENIEPMLASETVGPEGQTLADGPLAPEVVVNPVVELPDSKDKPQQPKMARVPATNAKPNEAKGPKPSFSGRPSLDNVPPFINDLGVTVLNMGYV